MLIIWGLRVVYRTLGHGVFFCRRCGGDRGYLHRSGRRFVTVFFIPLIPLAKTGEHVQCASCKTRYVTEVLRLPTTVQMQLAVSSGMRALVATMLNAGDPASPRARRRAIEAVTGTGERGYDEQALDADLAEYAGRTGSAGRARGMIAALGSQLQVHAREWYLAEVIRIGLADGPLTGAERAAAEHLADTLGMTQAQAVGVIALTEQNAGLLSPISRGTTLVPPCASGGSAIARGSAGHLREDSPYPVQSLCGGGHAFGPGVVSHSAIRVLALCPPAPVSLVQRATTPRRD